MWLGGRPLRRDGRARRGRRALPRDLLLSCRATARGAIRLTRPATSASGSGARSCGPRQARRPTSSTSTTPFRIEFECWNLRDGARLNLSLHIYDANGILVFNAVPVNERELVRAAYPRGLFRDICHVPGDLLNDGVYSVELLVVEDGIRVIHQDPDALVFEVRDTLVRGGHIRALGGRRAAPCGMGDPPDQRCAHSGDFAIFGVATRLRAAAARRAPAHRAIARPSWHAPRRILDRRWVTNHGPSCSEFEAARRRAAVGVRHCVATCNGTIALEMLGARSV